MYERILSDKISVCVFEINKNLTISTKKQPQPKRRSDHNILYYYIYLPILIKAVRTTTLWYLRRDSYLFIFPLECLKMESIWEWKAQVWHHGNDTIIGARKSKTNCIRNASKKWRNLFSEPNVLYTTTQLSTHSRKARAERAQPNAIQCSSHKNAHTLTDVK